MEQTRTIKIRLSTYRVLKVLAAQHGISMLALLDRLVAAAQADKQGKAGPPAQDEGQADA